ncbi:hypothetical protein L3Y34_012588 [Caenorhabditis briggsae]|uniref:Uncharacterized protein n=1 Tax=Caenorhabditis briggsae TaxID=6238 RepID=A0AAE9CW18_CAEBR|nr:hypothetical protein L3Y34_012588 [Caenorhabditis briggsae]
MFIKEIAMPPKKNKKNKTPSNEPKPTSENSKVTVESGNGQLVRDTEKTPEKCVDCLEKQKFFKKNEEKLKRMKDSISSFKVDINRLKDYNSKREIEVENWIAKSEELKKIQNECSEQNETIQYYENMLNDMEAEEIIFEMSSLKLENDRLERQLEPKDHELEALKEQIRKNSERITTMTQGYELQLKTFESLSNENHIMSEDSAALKSQIEIRENNPRGNNTMTRKKKSKAQKSSPKTDANTALQPTSEQILKTAASSKSANHFTDEEKKSAMTRFRDMEHTLISDAYCQLFDGTKEGNCIYMDIPIKVTDQFKKSLEETIQLFKQIKMSDFQIPFEVEIRPKMSRREILKMYGIFLSAVAKCISCFERKDCPDNHNYDCLSMLSLMGTMYNFFVAGVDIQSPRTSSISDHSFKLIEVVGNGTRGRSAVHHRSQHSTPFSQHVLYRMLETPILQNQAEQKNGKTEEQTVTPQEAVCEKCSKTEAKYEMQKTELKKTQQEIETVKKQLENAKLRNSSLRKEEMTLKKKAEKMENLQRDCNEHAETIRFYENSMNDVGGDFVLDDIQMLSEGVQKLSENNNQRMANLNHLQQEIAEQQQGILALTQQNESLRENYHSVKNKMEQAENEKIQLQQKRTSLLRNSGALFTSQNGNAN